MVALLLVSLLFVRVQADQPAVRYHYKDDANVSLDIHTPIIMDENDDNKVWNALRDDDTAFLCGIIEKTDVGQMENSILTASPPLLEDGEDLVISWSGVKSPHATDFIGLSCGPQAHAADFLVKADVPLIYDGLHWKPQEVENSVRFSSLYMMRCNYTVEYFNFQPQSNVYVRLAKLQVGMVEAFTVPKQGHIAFTDHVDEMSVMFNSASRETPVVKYGLDSLVLDQQAEGTSKTYTAAHLCNRPANCNSQQWFRDPGNMHRVVLKGLNLGTRYFYKFGSDKDGWSSTHSFMSRPNASVKRAKFIAYADMGVESAPAATSTAARSYQDIVDGGYDSFLLHFGDISYARGHAHIWDEFFHIIEPHATRVPYMVSIGNHEYDYMAGGANDPSGAAGSDGRMAFHPDWANYDHDSAGECSVPMFYRWDAPSNGNGIYWYSFDYGGIHVVQISSEHDWRRGSKQYKWLDTDLGSVDRSKTPWVILTSHRMMYTTQLGEEEDYRVAEHFRYEVEDLLWEHKVNLMLVGHQHSYERSCAVRNGKCTEDGQGPIHIVIGSAGAVMQPQGFSDKLGKWSVSHVNEWGYLRVDSTDESMRVQFVLNRNGAVYDEVKLNPWK